MIRYVSSLAFVFLLALSQTSVAEPKWARWTGSDDKNAELGHILEVIQQKTGIQLATSDFSIIEERQLANNYFTQYVQMAGGLPRRSLSVRTWTLTRGGDAIQVEALIDTKIADRILNRASNAPAFTSEQTLALVKEAVRTQPEDNVFRGATYKDMWDGQTLVRIAKARAKRGVHTIVISLTTRRVIQKSYKEFPQAGRTHDEEGEFSIPAQIYPIYEEVESTGSILPRIAGELKYIKELVRRPATNPFAPLLTQRYFFDKFDPILGLTEEGRKQGYWAMGYIKAQADILHQQIEVSQNAFEGRGVILEGRYASVNLHPAVTTAFPNLSFTPAMSGQFRPDWKPTPENPDNWEMIPSSTILGKPLKSLEEAMNRPARRLPDHDPVGYLNDGFDELQVYWAINQMFDSLKPMGFTDPELSTRRFNAFLFDPDIEMRDNAYYTDDTINFTTYSSKSGNMARDNTTIWHELGHGVMDRLMGDDIRLADTGGLSEGMADFVAQLVLNDVTNGNYFPGKETMRIFNKTGFYLTNEVHDDGEAYGGSFNDLLESAMRLYGRAGLTKVTDLTLEAMRLSRNHPGLTAVDWFQHMLFADDLGNAPVRAAGELRPLITRALAGRNFNLDGSPAATYTMMHDTTEVVAGAPGSRQSPIPLTLKETETSTHHLKLMLKSTPTYAFKYPVTVKVQLRGGPLQGAIHWHGEETEPLVYRVVSENDTLPIDLTVSGKCDEVNRPDGSCVDFAYVQVWNDGETSKPQAKKRFYLRVIPKPE